MVAGAWPEETADSDIYHVVVNEGWAMQNLGLSDRDVVGTVLGYAVTLDGTWDGKSTPQIPMVVDGVVATNRSPSVRDRRRSPSSPAAPRQTSRGYNL